jgi:hypothetical protein
VLTGTIQIGARDWEVREEKRAGPQSQLFVLEAKGSPAARMHVRALPGTTVTELKEVELLAADPQIRWFTAVDGVAWETRIVLHSEPDAVDSWRIKFISENNQVLEGPYDFKDGLGLRTDDELAQLLPQAG